MLDGDLVLHLQYPWQRFLLDAFMEFDPKQLPAKVGAAQRVIAERLCDIGPADMDEQIALQDAKRSLRTLFPQSVGADEVGHDDRRKPEILLAATRF